MSEKQKRLVLIGKEKMDTRIQGNFNWRLQL